MRTLILTLILLLTSCSKDSIEVCGTIVGGYSEVDPMSGWTHYYFRLDTTKQKQKVDELTYYSFLVGDYVCLQ